MTYEQILVILDIHIEGIEDFVILIFSLCFRRLSSCIFAEQRLSQ